MKALATAIYTKVTAETGGVHNSFYTALSGKFYKGQAPQTTTGLYCCYFFHAEVPEYYFGGKRFENVIVQFDLYSDASSSETIENARDYLVALFDDCKLTVSGFEHYLFERTNGALTQDDDGTWDYMLEYRVTLYT